MRVLLVDFGREWRGGQRQVALLARGLRQRGHPVAAVVPGRTPLAAELAAGGVPVVARAARSDLDGGAALSVARASRRFGVDIVHAHDARAHAIARWAALIGRRGALVVTRRVLRVPRGGWKYRRGVDAYVAVSEAVRRSLAAAGIDAARVRVVPDGVPAPRDAEPTEPIHRRFGIDEDRALVVSVLALSPEKGPALVLDAAAKLERDGVRCAWVLVGAGALEGSLRRSASARGLPVYFGGFVGDPGPWIRAACVFLHPAREEGLGSVLLDALARGVPVVATRVGGIPEVVSEDCGLLVPAGDVGALADAVARLLADPALRGRLARGARERALVFSADRMVEGTLAVYTRAAERQAGGAP